MTVKLREKELNERYSYYLQIYHNGKYSYEYLKLYRYKKPKDQLQRTHNKETKELAQKIAAKRQLQYQNIAHGFPAGGDQEASFITYLETLAEKRINSPGNYGNWLSTIKHMKSYHEGDIRFSDISTRFLKGFKDYLLTMAVKPNGEELTANSASSYFNKVKAALKQAMIDGILTHNPGARVKGIKESLSMREYLTVEEIQKLKETPFKIPLLKNAFLFSCMTGLRFSDIQKLTWGEIQKTKDDHYIRFRQKKTDMPETLPFNKAALDYLGKRSGHDDPVFTDLTYSDANNKKIQEWVDKAGINKHITFHCGRHTYATMLLTKGADIYTVSKLLGHKNLKTTEVYAKIIDPKKFEAVNKLKL